jgi:membrane-bound lytic murein transglycosylase A
MRGAAVMLAGALALCACSVFGPAKPPAAITPPLRLDREDFAQLQGWSMSDPAPALAAFRRSCAVIAAKPDMAAMGGLYAGRAEDWRAACAAASMAAPTENPTNENSPGENATAARAFFESAFVPYLVSQGTAEGLFTGYYEPQLRGSRTRHGKFQTPLYGVPADLVTIDLGLFRPGLKGQSLTGQVANGRVTPYPARARIAHEGLAQAKALFYVDDPVDAFFLQIQGSGRIALDDGSVVRAAYAGQNGQPYTAIGAVLIARGALKREDVSLQSIRAWIAAHPGDAQGLLDEDASYVFFAERPLGDTQLGASGAQRVALTPEASLAVDPHIHAMGAPVWIEASAPDPDVAKPDRPFDRLLVMQDVGGAIKGAVRGDVYWGHGAQAEAVAGRMKNHGRMIVLLPKALARTLGTEAEFTAP